jgi:N-acyl-L-homoserine lactone synthetase
MDHAPVGIVEESYVVKWQLTPTERRQVHALRADVFCRELEWVGAPSDRLERDGLDPYATQLAVVFGSEIVGTVRLAAYDAPWMLDGVFRGLLPEEGIRRGADCVEASRLAVAHRWRRARLENGAAVSDLLYKATYAFCRLRGVRRVYMVTSDVVLRLMRRSGLPVTALAAPTQMPDGVRAVALVLDWDRLAETCPRHEWFEAVRLSIPCSLPSQPRDMESRRRASP